MTPIDERFAAARGCAKRVLLAAFGEAGCVSENFDLTDVDQVASLESQPPDVVVLAFALVFTSFAQSYGISKRDQQELLSAAQRSLP